mgnify:CR=1 FL=1
MKSKIIYKDKVFSKYILKNQIDKRIIELSDDINNTKSIDSVFIGVLDGSIRFMMDIIKNIKFSYEIGFIKIKSYNSMNREEIKLILDIDAELIHNKNIYIVEDIVDSGETIKFLKSHFLKMNPKSIKTISLLSKESVVSKCDYYGFIIKNKFVIGYGLDINNLFRDLNDIYALEENEK